jgi:hypothetical protein
MPINPNLPWATHLQAKDNDALDTARDAAAHTPNRSLQRLLVLATTLSAQHATGNFTGGC